MTQGMHGWRRFLHGRCEPRTSRVVIILFMRTSIVHAAVVVVRVVVAFVAERWELFVGRLAGVEVGEGACAWWNVGFGEGGVDGADVDVLGDVV